MRTTARATLKLVAAGAIAWAQPALAVDLFVKPAASGTACTQSSPCSLATAVAIAVEADTLYLAAGTYTGTGAEVVALDKNLSLLGGWNGSPSGAVARDPVAYESILDGESVRRVVKITGGAPTLDGLTITRGNASGQAQGCGASTVSPDGCGGGIFINGAGVTLRGSLITDNVATSNAANPTAGGYGGGLYGFLVRACTIENSTFRGNVASTAGPGIGGALEMADAQEPLTVNGNRFTANRGTTAEGTSGYGGAVSFHNCLHTPVEVAFNSFSGNVARATPYDSDTNSDGNAVYAYGSAPTLRGNTIRSDAYGFAVALILSEAVVTGNTVISGLDSSSLYFYYGLGSKEVVINNVLVGGSYATLRAHAPGGSPMTLDVLHNTIVNSATATGILIGENATASLRNNIVAGHATAIRVEDTGSVAADHTLFWNNSDDGIRGADSIDGDPVFVNAAAGDFHIQAGSAAYNAGVQAYRPCTFPICPVTNDIDSDPRPGLGGTDVGADELAPRAFDFGTPASPVAAGFTRVTHSTTFSSGLGFGWNYGTIGSRDRGTGDDRQRDFCFTHTGTFAVTIPNGRYRVTLTMGDATAGHGQMAVFLENQKVATVNTAGNEFKELTFETAVTDGELTVWLNDEGGSDPNVVINALVIEKAMPVLVDLGTATSPLAAGYTRGTHASAYSPAAGFGWLGGIVQSRDRGTADSLRRDLVFAPRALLGLFLANGIYDVTLTLGDAAGTHDQMGVSVQGTEPESVTAAKNQFVTLRRHRVCVADNRLDILLDDLGGADANVVVNAIEVRRPPLLFFDFGTPTSPVAPGYVQVTHLTRYADGRGYGWTSGTVQSRDRVVASDLLRDLAFSPNAEFAVDVVSGTYQVTITLGDATGRHDLMGVFLEGELVNTVTTGTGGLATATYSVLVKDGRLDVGLVDQGGTDPNVAIVALEVR